MISEKSFKNGTDDISVNEYTPGIDVYDLVPLFFSLLENLELEARARKDDYGNITLYVRKEKR